MLWTAPEILRMKRRPISGTQKGDVYSFAIIAQEIAYMALPFFCDEISPRRMILLFSWRFLCTDERRRRRTLLLKFRLIPDSYFCHCWTLIFSCVIFFRALQGLNVVYILVRWQILNLWCVQQLYRWKYKCTYSHTVRHETSSYLQLGRKLLQFCDNKCCLSCN